MFKNSNVNKLFFKWIKSYIPMIVIPSVIIIVIFSVSNAVINSKIVQYTNERVDGLRYTNDVLFEGLNSYSYSLMTDETFVSLSKLDRNLTTTELFNTIEILKKYSNSFFYKKGIAMEFIIYLPNSDYILRHDVATKSFNYFSALNKSNYSFADFNTLLKQNNSFVLRNIPILDTSGFNSVYYVVTAKSQGVNNDITVLFQIDTMLLNKMMQSVANTVILDENSNVICSNTQTANLNIKGFTKIKSEISNIFYVYKLENSIIINGLKITAWVVALGLLITLIVLGISVYLSAKKSYLPFKEITEMIPSEEWEDDVGVIDNIREIITTNKIFREKLFGTSTHLSYAFFKEIINCDYSEFAIKEFNKAGVYLDNKHFILFVCEFESFGVLGRGENLSEDSELIHFAFQNIVSELLKDCNTFFVSAEKNNIVLLTSDNMFVKEQIKKELNFLIKLFQSEFKIGLLIGIGNFVSDKRKLASCYNEALDALKYIAITNSENVVFYDELLENDEDNYLFYSEDEQKNFINLIFNSETENANMEVLRLFKKYEMKENLSLNYTKSFMVAVCSLAAGVLHEFQMKDFIDIKTVTEYFNKMINCNNIKEFKKITIKITSELLQIASEKQSKQENHIITNVKEYISENYRSQNLSNEMLAEMCDISSTYLSFIFKVETGQNLSTYIKQYRISKAIELINQTDSLIKDIAVSCGVPDLCTFNRIFKKHTGFTPTEYRNNL